MNRWPEHDQFRNHKGAWLEDHLERFRDDAGEGELTPPEKESLAYMFWSGGAVHTYTSGPGIHGLIKRKYVVFCSTGYWARDTHELTAAGHKAAMQLLQVNAELPL